MFIARLTPNKNVLWGGPPIRLCSILSLDRSVYSANISLAFMILSDNANLKDPAKQNAQPLLFFFRPPENIQIAVECTCTSMKAVSPIELSRTCCIAYMEIAFPAPLITQRLWRRGFIEVYCIAHYLVTFTSRLIREKISKPFPHPTDLICMDSWQHQIALQPHKERTIESVPVHLSFLSTNKLFFIERTNWETRLMAEMTKETAYAM